MQRRFARAASLAQRPIEKNDWSAFFCDGKTISQRSACPTTACANHPRYSRVKPQVLSGCVKTRRARRRSGGSSRERTTMRSAALLHAFVCAVFPPRPPLQRAGCQGL